MTPAKQMDPWGQVDDLHGTALYNILEIGPRAKSDEVKKAYRNLARQHHPDKGGDPLHFGKIQHAYEVLSDHRRRQVYDTWAKELQFRYVRPSHGTALGGEDILLNELDALGLSCDPATQLVVTCEVCRRPATKECWTCGMKICEFCTLKRHWKDGVPLHWPLINSNHMQERLAKRELERKRIDDAKQLELEDPNHRTESELQDIRAFKEAAYQLLQSEQRHVRQTTYDLRIARFYMWYQTSTTVFIACKVPTGYGDKELVVESTLQSLLIQAEGSPALIDRLLAHPVDPEHPIETIRTEDNRVCAVMITKAEPGQHWNKLFQGDPDGARSMKPPYDLFETDDDVIIQLALPFWIDNEDLRVDIGEESLKIFVRNTVNISRRYWRNIEEESKRRDYRVVEKDQSCWTLEEDTDSDGDRCKMLTVNLARPDPSEEEIQWKKGKRQDNRAAQRPGSMHDKGFRFFADDEDGYGLETVLQALAFAEAGKTYIPNLPWRQHEEPRWAHQEWELPQDARSLFARLQKLNEK